MTAHQEAEGTGVSYKNFTTYGPKRKAEEEEENLRRKGERERKLGEKIKRKGERKPNADERKKIKQEHDDKIELIIYNKIYNIL